MIFTNSPLSALLVSNCQSIWSTALQVCSNFEFCFFLFILLSSIDHSSEQEHCYHIRLADNRTLLGNFIKRNELQTEPKTEIFFIRPPSRGSYCKILQFFGVKDRISMYFCRCRQTIKDVSAQQTIFTIFLRFYVTAFRPLLFSGLSTIRKIVKHSTNRKMQTIFADFRRI
jgi:hypothetical protein